MERAGQIFFATLLLCGCKPATTYLPNAAQNLHKPPVQVTVKTGDGYSVNPLTGEAVLPLVNTAGDTLQSGVPKPFTGKAVQPFITATSFSAAFQGTTTAIAGNVVALRSPVQSRLIDTASLKQVYFGKGDTTFVLRHHNRVLATGVPLPVSIDTVPCKESPPVKALPMRRKDDATCDIQYLDVDQGLSFSYINSILCDRKGYLWLGTDGLGISRYNGISFTNYGQQEGLRAKLISALLEDSKGNLWIGSHNGVCRFDGKNFLYFDAQAYCADTWISSISEDSRGNIWIFSNGVASVYDGDAITLLTAREGLPYATGMAEDGNGNKWFSTSAGLVRYNGQYFSFITTSEGLPTDTLDKIAVDKEGTVWFSCSSLGIGKLQGSTLSLFTTDDGLPGNTVVPMVAGKQGEMLIGTVSGGLSVFNGEAFSNYGQQQGLLKDKVTGLTEDNFGNIWASLEGGGLNRIHPTGFSYPVQEMLHGKSKIRPIVKDATGKLWMGTEAKGIGVYDGAKSSFTFIQSVARQYNTGQRSLLMDRAGSLWIGTNDQGVIKITDNNLTQIRFPDIADDNLIFDILQDKQGHYWFSTKKGTVIRYDGSSFTRYNAQEEYWRGSVYSMLQDRQGNIWFCTAGGLICYDGTNALLFSEREGLCRNDISSAIQDANGNLWLGTLGAGLCRFDGRQFTFYSEKQGISNSQVWSVYQDSYGHIWAGTDRGLNLLLPMPDSSGSKYQVYNYGLQNGLRALDFNLHSVCEDNNHRLWWGTGKGVVCLDLARGIPLYKPAAMRLNALAINNRFYDFKNLPDSLKSGIGYTGTAPFANYPQQLALAHDFNHLTFSFSALDWSSPDDLLYSYRLLGGDGRWSQPSAEPVADYRNLRYGEYEFQVKAIGKSRVWTEPFVYRFVVLPAWWQTWWFRTCAIISSLAVVFLIIRFMYLYRLRRQRQQYEKELAVQYERQRISAEMHDDLGAGLSGVRLLTEIARAKMRDDTGRQEMDAIHQSVGELSSRMREVIWSLNTENDTLLSLVTYIQKQVKAMLEHYPASVKFDIIEPLPDLAVHGEARRNIYLCVKEAVHNIMKHARATRVTITVAAGNSLNVTVADNGTGLTEGTEPSGGYGFRNMRNRMAALQGRLTVQSGNGVTITLEIPTDKL